MPRPVKCRRVCGNPGNHIFLPQNELNKENLQTTGVVMSVVEYETIRLMDYENLTQAECAIRMDIARTTVTAIYESARKKVADALVNGKRLNITGGNYVICEYKDVCCKTCGSKCNSCKEPCKRITG